MLDQNFEVMDFEEYSTYLRLQATASMYAKLNGQESTEEEILSALIATEKYNQSLYEKTDSLLDYNDEIVAIEELDDDLTMDISVAGDQLFYADGVLTKNSAGLPATADFILAVIETPELAENGQQLIKQIKSRYGDKFFIDKFFIGVKKGNQRWVEMDIDKADVSNNEEAMKAMRNTQKASEPPSSTRSMIDDLVDDLKTDKKENAKTCKW